MKLYTRTGDDGSTSLFGGHRVPKAALRVEAYGGVDELNACLGLVRAASEHGKHSLVEEVLSRVQSELFDLGAHLATPGDASEPVRAALPAFAEAHITWLEQAIDRATQPVPELREFILPGGSEVGARLHHARTVCRRAERMTVLLGEQKEEQVDSRLVVYLNRLSDLLFALARLANQEDGHAETVWKPRVGDQ
ncbi:MAG: cob(I)yrinic acid a,c-diamide adenosyltransferase [Phycisphaeraceae bacterium]